ncbi:murein biosynthesis integral membrane protein MurJ [Brevibacterium sp. UCMA 11752]|uniref:murein biosynthesis integral membrane protein MurJ n=1 Tax=Brevibacterium sp. UCMA 11752 TaxID=2745946 RepID=UPI001F182001|nr:lipid II flippase MurJ [Brevibacterium sp. UCMA 11752]MCF2587807.1 virulence factor MviN [Brevibacterium sp. UCMA 11752]
MSKLVRVFASAALLVSVITLFTRLIGFLRWLVFSPTVGVGTVGTAYQSANQIPNILFEVVAGGALAGAVIPLLAIPLARSDKETAGRIASALLTWAVSVTLPLSIILAVFADPIANLLIEDGGEQHRATAVFLFMFAPQLVLYGIGAVLTGVLQAHRKFLWPAFAPLLSSLVVIGCYFAYQSVGGTDGTWQSHIGWLGWGTTIGVAALALPLALPMRSTGLTISPTWTFPPGVAHRALRLAGAGMAALLAQQAAVLSTLIMANYSGGEGTYVLFAYINAVYLLPYGVLAIPLVTVMFPSVSGWVGRTKDPDSSAEDREAATLRLHQLTSTTTTVIVSIGLLGTVILMTAAGALETFFTAIDAASGHGSAPFSSMSQAIMVMALAVPGWSFVAWGTRVFYAMERSRHAAVATTVGWVFVIVGMVLAILVTNADGDAGLTLVAICAGYVLGMSVAGLFLLVSMRRVLGAVGLRGIVRRSLHSLLAAAVASVAGVLVSGWLVGPLGTAAVGSVINGVVSALVGVVIFIGILAIDRSYLTEVRGLLSNRRGGPDLAEQTDPAVQAQRPITPSENEDER